MPAGIKPFDIVHTRQLAHRVSVIRWIGPIILFVIVLVFESIEHLLTGHGLFELRFGFEVIFFGMVGPFLIGAILTWISLSLDRLASAYEEIHVLNAELETRIEDRTKDLAKANMELRQLDRLKSEFVSLVSHELRTPLTNIQGGLELGIQETGSESESLRGTLLVVQSEVKRLIRVVTQILDVSVLKAGHIHLNLGPVALRPLVDRASSRCGLPGEKHPLTIQIPHHLVPVWADEDRLTDIVANLLDNAVKYSPEGGEIRVIAQIENGHIHLSIRDHGRGISSLNQTRLFEYFCRGEQVDAIPGYGLGLYFCNKFVQAQNGRIWIESNGQPGEGTTVHLALPVENEAEHDPYFVD